MAKRVLPIDTSALDVARSASRAQRSNPAMADDKVYAEVRALIQDENRESLNVAQDLLIENGCNLVELGETVYGPTKDWSEIDGCVSSGAFNLIDIMKAPSDETQMRWIVYDMTGFRYHAPDPHPTQRYQIKIDLVYRGRITLRDNFPRFAMLEDARRICAKVCWEGVKAFRHHLFTNNLSGGREYRSGSSSWKGYIETPPEVVDRRRPCDDFFDLLLDPDPASIDSAQKIAVANNYRLSALSAMSLRSNYQIRPDQDDPRVTLIAAGAFVMGAASPLTGYQDCAIWTAIRRAHDRVLPYSTDVQVRYRGDVFYRAMGGYESPAMAARAGAWSAWDRAKAIRYALSRDLTPLGYQDLAMGDSITGIVETPREIINPTQRSKKPRAEKAPVRIVAKIASELTSPFPPGSVANTPETLVHYIDTYMHQATEVFMGVFLSIRNHIVGYSEFNSGLTSGVEVGATGLFQAALLAGAAGIITVHNHPSGNITPSDEDFHLWERLRQIGTILGLPVVDNLVIGKGKFYSEAASGHRRGTSFP